MYRVDGEVGRFKFKTHKFVTEETTIIDTSRDVFRTLYSKEWYRTQGFNELAFPLVIDESYRKACKKLNRVRREKEDSTPARTLSSIVEIEGNKINKTIIEKVSEVLLENEFNYNGVPNNKNHDYGIEIKNARVEENILQEKINNYNKNHENNMKIDLSECNSFYEKKINTVNISIDDVGVKKQVEHRKENKDKPLKYVRNTIVHIENSKEKYFLNAESTVAVIPIIIAFLLSNRLINSYIQFFVDGERSLHSAIISKFNWHKSFGILLDWYHLKKKCETELSLAIKGKDKRNAILEDVLKYLWHGKIGEAKKVLEDIEESYIKNSKNIMVLIQYYERNRSYIPCYALRKELGLRNSSNKGEKLNDLIVSDRQKHNGMSWSKSGSVALATVTTASLNNELQGWFDTGTIKFKLAS